MEVLDDLVPRIKYIMKYYDTSKMKGNYKDDDTPTSASRKKVVDSMADVIS